MDTATLSEEHTLSRFNKAQERIIERFGDGDTAGAMGIAREYVEELATYIKQELSKPVKDWKGEGRRAAVRLLQDLDPAVVALSTLNSVLSSVAISDDYRGTVERLGGNIAGEAFAAGLLKEERKKAEDIDAWVRKKYGDLRRRREAVEALAARNKFKTTRWSREECVEAGSVLLQLALSGLPDVFTLADGGVEPVVTVTDAALNLAEEAVEQTLRKNAVFLPSPQPLKPWTAFSAGGFWDSRARFRCDFMRTPHKETRAAVKAAMRDGTMQAHVDGVNNLQSVAWQINTWLLDVLVWAFENDVKVPGLPTGKPVKMPKAPLDLDEAKQRLWKKQRGDAKNFNLALSSNRIMFKQDRTTAEMLAVHDRFYVPCNVDWRGRVYSIPSFNFQRDDRVRALFLFADGEPIGEEGLWWLKVHVANCGDFNKISKRPLEERVQWVDDNWSQIISIATSPTSSLWWTSADKPFLFLAACGELVNAVNQGPSFKTHLPVSFDGSCSGLQHLCAMTRAPEGSLVNLTAQAVPQDVYQTVADRVNVILQREAADDNVNAKDCLDYGIGRKEVKRNVMTYSYSSNRFGMAQQHMTDLMDPLKVEVIEGKREEHPFGPDEGRIASKYLAGHVFDSIEQIVHLPAVAMRYLRKLAKAMAHEGKALAWTTPTGLPWVNRYHRSNVTRVSLWLHDTRVLVNLAEGYSKEIDKDKAANGVAPNFVHALDAAHLILTVNAATREGITQIATVHDSFGCLASRARRFNQIIREQFVEMYEQHDVLTEVLEAATRDLAVHNCARLPEPIIHGSLNLKEVLNAHFAFA